MESLASLSDPVQRQQLEYSTQFFDFTPDSFIDSIMEDAVQCVQTNLEEARKHCSESFSGKVSDPELQDSFQKIEEPYVEAAEKVYYKLGQFIKENVLRIPPDLLLPEDSSHGQLGREYLDAKDLDAAKTKFKETCQKVRNLKYTRAVLRNKLKNLREVREGQLEALREAREVARERSRAAKLERECDELEEKARLAGRLLKSLDSKKGLAKGESEDKEGRKRQFEREDQALAKRFKVSEDEQ